MSDFVKITGAKELADSLKALAPTLYNNRLKRTVEKAAKVVELRAIRNAHAIRDTGALSRAIISKGTRKGSRATGIIGIESSYSEKDRPHRRTKSGRIIPVKYARLVEYGVESRDHSGPMSPKPFMRPALATSAQEVQGIMANEMRDGLAQATHAVAKPVKGASS